MLTDRWSSCPRLARARASCFTARMALPYKISSLLYCFNERDDVLLLERRKEPNLGLWSPCGGKLKTEAGESPYACACREAAEEIGLRISPAALHLTGIVSEHGYEGQAHWDREQLWPLFWGHRGGFFAAHCHCHPDGRNDWTLEESTQNLTHLNARRTDH